MYNAELYQTNNLQQQRDARQGLEMFSKVIKWKSYGATVIDIGCGDGGVTTSILKTYLPDNFKALVGCDINEENIQFANEHHARDNISFMVLDIESNLPDQFRERFDHAFSFYVLHWIKNQEIAFTNIYNLLTRGGDCLLIFLGHLPVYEVYRKLARSPRWNYWMKDVERFVSPYHDSQNPEKDIKTMMTTIGFTNVIVKCLQNEFVHIGIEHFENALKAVNVFKVPLEMHEDFFDDHVKIFHDMKVVDHRNNNMDGPSIATMKYKLIIAYGKK